MRYGRILFQDSQPIPERGSVNARVDPDNFHFFLRLDTGQEIDLSAGGVTEVTNETEPVTEPGIVAQRFNKEDQNFYIEYFDEELQESVQIPLSGFNGNRTIKRSGIPNVNVGGKTVEQFLNNFFFPSIAPVNSVSINKNIEEKGLTFAPVVTGNVTVNDGQVTNRKLYINNVLVNNPATNAFSYNDIGRKVNTDYKYEIDYTVDGVPGTTSKSTSLVFYAPSYNIVAPIAGATEAQVKAYLHNGASTKAIVSKQARTLTFTGSGKPAYYYPASYGDLSIIRDQNGFNVTDGFVKKTTDFTLADGTIEPMFYYELKEPTTVNNFQYTFTF